MFDRVKFKKNAKAQLKGRFKIPLLASLTIALINLVISTTSNLLQDTEIAATAFSVFQFIATSVLCYAFVFLCLKVVKTDAKLSYSDFTDGFSLIKPAILGNLWNNLFIVLWSLVAIVPVIIIALITANSMNLPVDKSFNGIYNWSFHIFTNYLPFMILIFLLLIASIIFIAIKSIQYSQMPFIIAENKNISVRKAMKLSIELTKGNKGNLFVLGLSFIGWYLLVLVPVVIVAIIEEFFPTLGFLILAEPIVTYISFSMILPYIETAFVNAYLHLKESAINLGKLKQEDFEQNS
ncbi:MAG: DUF975 family protein [Treponema sp.]